MDFNYSTQHNGEVARSVISFIANIPLNDRLELLKEIEHKFMEDKKISGDSNANIDSTTG